MHRTAGVSSPSRIGRAQKQAPTPWLPLKRASLTVTAIANLSVNDSASHQPADFFVSARPRRAEICFSVCRIRIDPAGLAALAAPKSIGRRQSHPAHRAAARRYSRHRSRLLRRRARSHSQAGCPCAHNTSARIGLRCGRHTLLRHLHAQSGSRFRRFHRVAVHHRPAIDESRDRTGELIAVISPSRCQAGKIAFKHLNG